MGRNGYVAGVVWPALSLTVTGIVVGWGRAGFAISGPALCWEPRVGIRSNAARWLCEKLRVPPNGKEQVKLYHNGDPDTVSRNYPSQNSSRA
jgi:hypothetical protein